MKTELLSPAKDKYTAFEAINCGADAIYIGASNFGARQNAKNSIEDIKEVINYAHKFWVKVYVTVNTILTDNELECAVNLAKDLYNIGVDALIIQDMGLLKRLKEENIPIPIHISTQCDNRDIEKVTFFNKIGVNRVVLARELPLDKIREIHLKNPNLELEAFVHGALCVSYSGQCYLSQYIGKRSANRGECAQPCRKKYSVITENGKILLQNAYALCLKDFNASNDIEEMTKSGIFSFKIEGRLKDIGYVKNVTAYYRLLLNKFSTKSSSGKSFYKFTPDTERTFNRGYTNYFLKGRCDSYNFVSPKSKGKYIGKIIKSTNEYFILDKIVKISPQDGLCYQADNNISGFLVNRIIENKIFPNKTSKLPVGTKIYRNYDVEFEKLLKIPTKRQIGVNISIIDCILKVTDEDNNSFEIKIPDGEIANNQQKANENFVRQLSKTGDEDFYITNFELNCNIPFLPISKINEFRRTVFSQLMNLRIKNYKREIQKDIQYTKYYKKEVDYRANVHNKEAEAFYNNCGCKVLEKSIESNPTKKQIELMRTKHCIKYALNMCKSTQNLVLVDEFNKKYPLKFDCKNCEMIILSDK